MTRDSDRNGDSRQDRDGLGPKGESAGRQASPNSSHRPEDVGLVEKVARAICRANCPKWMNADEINCQVENGWDLWTGEALAVLSILTPYTVDGPK